VTLSESLSLYLDIRPMLAKQKNSSDQRAPSCTNEEAKEQHVLVQTEVNYTGNDGNRYCRVSTRRWRIASDTDSYLRSLDPTVCAVLLGKRACLEAIRIVDDHSSSGRRSSGGEGDEDAMFKELREETDHQMRALIRKIAPKTPAAKTTRNDQTSAHEEEPKENRDFGRVLGIPEQLRVLPEIVYYLRQGPLLGLAFQGTEYSQLTRQVFLNLPGVDASMVARPSLHAFDSEGRFSSMSLSTMAMRDDRILLLDHYTQIIIWVGNHLQTPECDLLRTACEEEAARLAAERSPVPEILVIYQGDSAERWVEARLSPGHKDSKPIQLSFSPELETEEGGEAARIAVCQRLARATKETSLFQYMCSLLK